MRYGDFTCTSFTLFCVILVANVSADFIFNGVIQHIQNLNIYSNFYYSNNSVQNKSSALNSNLSETNVSASPQSTAINSPAIQPPTINSTSYLPSDLTPKSHPEFKTSLSQDNSETKSFSCQNTIGDGVIFSSVDYTDEESMETLAIKLNCENIEWENATLTQLEEEMIDSGLALDLNYNETREKFDSPTKLISSPGCPGSRSLGGYIAHHWNRQVWVHYGNPPKCFLVGNKGPCPKGMKFAASKDSVFGECKCDCYFSKLEPETYNFNLELFDTIFDPYQENKAYCYDGSRHFVNYEGDCHQLLTQGPCSSSEIFLMDREINIPTCKTNGCNNWPSSSNVTNIDSYYFEYNNTCMTLEDECGIKDPDSIPLYLLVSEDNPFPECTSQKYTGLSSSPRFNPGRKACHDVQQRYSRIQKKCIPLARSQERKHVG